MFLIFLEVLCKVEKLVVEMSIYPEDVHYRKDRYIIKKEIQTLISF